MQTRELRLKQANGCPWYDPCPICYNCMNKASHLYARCASCQVPHDAHTHRHRSYMIRRENFRISLTPETQVALREFLNEQKER